MNALVFSLVLSSVLLNTIAQILLKQTMNSIGAFVFSWASILPIGLQVLFNVYFLVGMACYVFSVFIWLLVLSKLAVGIAYPMASLGYITTAIAAYIFLGESFSISRLIGIVIIIFGVYLVSR